MEYHELNVERDFCKKKITITTDKKTNNDIRILYFICKQVVQCPKKKCISFSRPIGYEIRVIVSLFLFNCISTDRFIRLSIHTNLYNWDGAVVAGRFVFVKAVDKQCIYIFVFVHYLSVLLHYVVTFWQGQFMMTYVKQYTLLELVMLNYLIQMDNSF